MIIDLYFQKLYKNKCIREEISVINEQLFTECVTDYKRSAEMTSFH